MGPKGVLMSNQWAVRLRRFTMKQSELSRHRSNAPSGISAPPGLDPPESRAETTSHLLDQSHVLSYKNANIVPYLAADVIIHMFCIDLNSMSIGNTLAQAFSD